MSTINKNKLLTGLVILLLLVNTITILFFWLGRSKNEHPSFKQPSEFLIKKLAMSAEQQDQYMKLVKDHRLKTKLIREQIMVSKDALFEQLSADSISDSLQQSTANSLAKLNVQLDLLTFEHFKKVRKMCNPQQQKKFDNVIKDVLKMMAPQRHPGIRPAAPGEPQPQHAPPPIPADE